METKVVYSKLVAKEKDSLDYTTYVFELLEPVKDLDKYVMCVRYPNWDHYEIEINDEGYLNFIEVIAGTDKYWDGHQFIPYNYSNWQFIKFVKKIERLNKELIVD